VIKGSSLATDFAVYMLSVQNLTSSLESTGPNRQKWNTAVQWLCDCRCLWHLWLFWDEVMVSVIVFSCRRQ